MANSRRDPATLLGWMRDGETFFARQLAALSDFELDMPSALPGWDRRTVAAHVARNAEALSRLLRWARTGIETPMYADATQRIRDIRATARQPATELRADVERTAAALSCDARISNAHWHELVRTARGREIPAAEVPWMRCREVWLHGLDLAAGAVSGDLPEEFAEVLIDDVTEFMSAQSQLPAVEITSTRTGRRWRIGRPEDRTTDPPYVKRRHLEVRGDPQMLALWMTGRGEYRNTLGPDEPPQLPPWL